MDIKLVILYLYALRVVWLTLYLYASSVFSTAVHLSTLDLSLSNSGEIVKRLCERLRTERLAQQMTQADVAARAGIGTNTVSNLESGRNVGFENLVRVAMVPGRAGELEALFMPKIESIDDIRRYEESSQRQHIKRKSHNA